MSTSFQFDMSSYLSTGYNLDQIREDVEAVITIPFSSYIDQSNTLHIDFQVDLNAEEQTTLYDTIANYTLRRSQGHRLLNLSINNFDINTTIYTVIAKTLITQEIARGLTHIQFLSNVSSGNYSVKLYDKTNRVVIGENTFTNTEDSVIDITPLSNVSNKQFIMEVHVKVDDSANAVDISECYIFYD